MDEDLVPMSTPMPFATTSAIITLVELDEQGEEHFRLTDVEIVRTYRLNDLGFWVVFRHLTGTNDGRFFVPDGHALTVVA